jgi:hypothetical protein
MKIFLRKYFPLFWFALIAVVLWALWGLKIVHASDDYDDDSDDTTPTTATADANAAAEALAEAGATANAIGEGGAGGAGGSASGGTSTVQTKNESTSLVLTGARDTAPCFTKVTIGAEGFGIGWSRSDPYCKKVRRIAAHLVLENWNAAARLECTLREWRDVYGRDAEACFLDLYAGPDEAPEPEIGGMYNQSAMVAQVAQEEFEAVKEQAQEQHEAVEYRQAQQQNKIDSLEQREAELRAEVERLRQEAAAKAAADEARRIALGKALKNYKVPEDDT